MNDHDDAVRDSLIGIKKKKMQRGISRFNAKNGLLYEVDESKIYVPGQGIEHIRKVNEKLLSCGHSAGFGVGHIAECGHAVCILCVERFVLECAEFGCFRKLCTVPDCECSACSVDYVFYCKKHAVKGKILSFACNIFASRSKNEERIMGTCGEYYSRRLQLRVKNEAQGKRESNT